MRILTKEEKAFETVWARFGCKAVVQKQGRNWVVGYGELKHPLLFKTKKAAIIAADDWACAMGNR